MSNNTKLVTTMLKNMLSKGMNRDMKGHSIHRTFAPITGEDVRAYVEATRDDPGRYTGENAPVPPMAFSRILYPMCHYFLTHPDLKINLLRLVHGEQSVRWIRPLHVGDVCDIDMSIADIADTSAGEIIRFSIKGSVGGKPAIEAMTGFLVRGTGSMRPSHSTHDETAGEEILRAAFDTEQGQQIKYAEVSGDGNFIHTSKLLAKLSGLPGTIMHGVCLLAMTGNCLSDEMLRGRREPMKSISVRFANPVIPGERVTIIVNKTKTKGRVTFHAVNARGKDVIKNGMFEFAC